MEIIFYTPFDKTEQDKLQKEMKNVVKKSATMVSSFQELEQILKKRISGHVLIVFFISSAEELDFLMMNNTILFNRLFIFILLKGDDGMVSKGLSLYPRYIAHMSPDFRDVSAVVERILKKETENRARNSV